MKRQINGKEYDIPANPDGTFDVNTIRDITDIPPDRVLILQTKDGSNRIINPNEKVHINPEDCISELAPTVRGMNYERSFVDINAAS